MNHRWVFLTSGGFTQDMVHTFFESIGKDPAQVRILFIPTAGIETDGAREGIAVCLHELSAMGIQAENILVYNLELLLSKGYTRTYSAYVHKPHILSRLLTLDELKTFDAVFVSGGDSAVLCREMVRTGFDEVLAQAVNDGLVYVGISAGSMYAAGNLQDGLRLIPNPIVPHWGGPKMVCLPKDGSTIELADGQAVFINGDNISLL